MTLRSILPFCYGLRVTTTADRPIRLFSGLVGSAVEKNKSLSIEQALYIAQIHGISTREEVTKQIKDSPSFSNYSSPFLLENFYDTIETTQTEDLLINPNDEIITSLSSSDSDPLNSSISSKNITNPVIYNILQAATDCSLSRETFFIPHSNKDLPLREHLTQAEGRGTSRRATAHVIIKRGTGLVKFQQEGNREECIYHRIPKRMYLYARFDMLQPFLVTETCGQYDLFISVHGGGIVGQALATRLALSRALLQACPENLDMLQKDFLLTEDLRQNMPKSIGRHKSRKAHQWSKR